MSRRSAAVVRRTTAPRAPRRVSGPAGGRRVARAAAPLPVGGRRLAAAGRGSVALPAPRIRARRPPAVDGLRRLPDARWLDRLLRGRAWIALVGGLLIGIVAMQVSLLEMNAGIGAAIERADALQRQNADLRAGVSRLSSAERIQAFADAAGLVMPPAGSTRYLRARGAEDARRAARIMRPPLEVPAPTAAALGAQQPPPAGPAPTAPLEAAPPPAPAPPPAGITAPSAPPPAGQGGVAAAPPGTAPPATPSGGAAGG